MNYWLLLCSPDKWFGDRSDENVKVNNMLLTLDEQRWRVQEKYFKDAEAGDICILKVGEDKRSIQRRTLKDNSIVDILESGIYAIGQISKACYVEDEATRIKFKCTQNLFSQNKIIKRENAERVLGDKNYFSMSSKKITHIEYQRVVDFLNEDDALSPNKESEVEIYPAQVKVERANYSIYELKRQHKKGKVIIDPSFQRESVWKSKKQKSELVESILMGIPLPIVYFSENNEGKLQVVDGRQRLTTLFDFLDDKFKLAELNILTSLKGLFFSDLSTTQQSDLEDYQLIAYVIKPPTPDRIKFDIFDRVNRGGTRLNNQEMRNALYQGKSVTLLNFLSQNENFKKATDNSINPIRMKDRYIILRFISFYLWQEKELLDKNLNLLEYKSDIDEFLGKSMDIINDFSDEKIDKLKKIFDTSMRNSYIFLGKNAFRIPSDSDKLRPVSMALFELFGYLMSFDFGKDIKKKVIKKRVQELFDNEEFLLSITYNLDSSVSVNQRFLYIEKVIKELKNDK